MAQISEQIRVINAQMQPQEAKHSTIAGMKAHESTTACDHQHKEPEVFQLLRDSVKPPGELQVVKFLIAIDKGCLHIGHVSAYCF